MLAAALLTLSLVVTDLPGATTSANDPAPTRRHAALDDPSEAFLRADVLIAQRQTSEVDALLDGGWLDYPTETASYFDVGQVVSFYGHPDVCIMGELGCHEPPDTAERIRDLTRSFDELNGARSAIPALHLIVDVAQRTPQDDGSYLDRMPMTRIAEWVEIARDRGMLLFLDLQIGWTDPLEGVERLAPFLAEPFVHVAIDPEFATGRWRAEPGEIIGAVRPDEVNEVQDYLAELVARYQLPKKILVLHQFRGFMLPSPEDYADVDDVEITIDMDGWGGDGPKIAGYELFALASYAERAAFKLFYHWDTPDVLTPEEIVRLPQPPDYVIYQ